MRVGLLIYGSLDSLSGGYLYDRKLVDHLRKLGDEVEILSLPWRGYFVHLADNFSKRFRRTLQQFSVDMLIQDELNHPSLAWLNRWTAVHYPRVALVHHLRCEETRPAWQNLFYRWVERCYLDSVDGFIFNSWTTRGSVDALSPIRSRPSVIATPAGDRFDPQIDASQIERRAWQPGPLRLIFLGNLIPRKGLHTLIQAMGQLPRGALTLNVVGDPGFDLSYWRKIQRKVVGLELSQQIHFQGIMEDDALALLLRESQVLVVPSSYEGFGIVYLEGMSFGLPAIGTVQGAAAEIILNGECGFLIKDGDHTTLADILKSLHQNRQWLADLSIAAKSRYSQFPGWEQSMAKVRAFLTNLL